MRVWRNICGWMMSNDDRIFFINNILFLIGFLKKILHTTQRALKLLRRDHTAEHRSLKNTWRTLLAEMYFLVSSNRSTVPLKLNSCKTVKALRALLLSLYSSTGRDKIHPRSSLSGLSVKFTSVLIHSLSSLQLLWWIYSCFFICLYLWTPYVWKSKKEKETGRDPVINRRFCCAAKPLVCFHIFLFGVM